MTLRYNASWTFFPYISYCNNIVYRDYFGHNGDIFSNYPASVFRSYPKTFGDIGKHGDTAGDGCHSLLQQVKTRVEYKNRNNTLARRRREGRQRTGMAGEARLARGLVDQYG